MKDVKSAVDEGNYLTIRDFKAAFNYFISGNPNIYKLLKNNYKDELAIHEFVYNSEFYSIKIDLVKDAIVNCTMKRYVKEDIKKEVDTINFDYDFTTSKFIQFNHLKTIFSEVNNTLEFSEYITDKKIK